MLLQKKLKVGNVCLIFDRYYNCSTKSVTRSGWTTRLSRVYQLLLNSNLLPQNTVLTVSEYKKQLISCVVKLLMEDAPFHEFTHTNVLRLFGQEAAPIEISHGGVVIRRKDLATNHEEADNIVVQ